PAARRYCRPRHLARVDGQIRRPAHRGRRVFAAAPRDAGARGDRRPRSVALALQDADRDGDQGRRRRPGHDGSAGREHPADVRDRVRRRLGTGGGRGHRRDFPGECRLGTGRPVAAQLARRRDRRRHGLDLRRCRRLAVVRARLHLLGRVLADFGGQLLHPVLDRVHVRPGCPRARVPATRPLREGLMTSALKLNIERGAGTAILLLMALGPLAFGAYWVSFILTQTFLIGIAAASLIFLSAYGGMVSLGQAALYGLAAVALGNIVTKGEAKGLHLGWNPWLGVVLAILITTALGLLLGAVASRSAGIYFLMITLTYSVIAYYFLGQVT